jgi:hypothetical protein
LRTGRFSLHTGAFAVQTRPRHHPHYSPLRVVRGMHRSGTLSLADVIICEVFTWRMLTWPATLKLRVK